MAKNKKQKQEKPFNRIKGFEKLEILPSVDEKGKDLERAAYKISEKAQEIIEGIKARKPDDKKTFKKVRLADFSFDEENRNELEKFVEKRNEQIADAYLEKTAYEIKIEGENKIKKIEEMIEDGENLEGIDMEIKLEDFFFEGEEENTQKLEKLVENINREIRDSVVSKKNEIEKNDEEINVLEKEVDLARKNYVKVHYEGSIILQRVKGVIPGLKTNIMNVEEVEGYFSKYREKLKELLDKKASKISDNGNKEKLRELIKYFDFEEKIKLIDERNKIRTKKLEKTFSGRAFFSLTDFVNKSIEKYRKLDFKKKVGIGVLIGSGAAVTGFLPAALAWKFFGAGSSAVGFNFMLSAKDKNKKEKSSEKFSDTLLGEKNKKKEDLLFVLEKKIENFDAQFLEKEMNARLRRKIEAIALASGVSLGGRFAGEYAGKIIEENEILAKVNSYFEDLKEKSLSLLASLKNESAVAPFSEDYTAETTVEPKGTVEGSGTERKIMSSEDGVTQENISQQGKTIDSSRGVGTVKDADLGKNPDVNIEETRGLNLSGDDGVSPKISKEEFVSQVEKNQGKEIAGAGESVSQSVEIKLGDNVASSLEQRGISGKKAYRMILDYAKSKEINPKSLDLIYPGQKIILNSDGTKIIDILESHDSYIMKSIREIANEDHSFWRKIKNIKINELNAGTKVFKNFKVVFEKFKEILGEKISEPKSGETIQRWVARMAKLSVSKQ